MAGQKLTHTEVEERISRCFELRYKTDPPIQQKQWVNYCHENYGDKSEKQYIQYWISARERYEEGWRSKLQKMLEPAMDELHGLLGSDDEKIRQRAIDQIVKYTGNDIEKIEAKIEANIELTWGDQQDPGDMNFDNGEE